MCRYATNGHERAASMASGGYGILLSEVVPESVKWSWKDRIARGKLNLVDGDPVPERAP